MTACGGVRGHCDTVSTAVQSGTGDGCVSLGRMSATVRWAGLKARARGITSCWEGRKRHRFRALERMALSGRLDLRGS